MSFFQFSKILSAKKNTKICDWSVTKKSILKIICDDKKKFAQKIKKSKKDIFFSKWYIPQKKIFRRFVVAFYWLILRFLHEKNAKMIHICKNDTYFFTFFYEHQCHLLTCHFILKNQCLRRYYAFFCPKWYKNDTYFGGFYNIFFVT